MKCTTNNKIKSPRKKEMNYMGEWEMQDARETWRNLVRDSVTNSVSGRQERGSEIKPSRDLGPELEPVLNRDLKRRKKGVTIVPKDKVIQKDMIESALKTHKDLGSEDRKYLIGEVIGMDLSDGALTNFILRTYKLSNTGRFSFIYNLDLDSHIKTRSGKRVRKLVEVAGEEIAWPEVFANPYLSDEERDTIEKMYNREYFAVLNSLERAKCNNRNLEEILPCGSSNTDSLYLSDNKLKYTTIYSQCYDNVCMSEAEQLGKIIALGNGNDEIPQIAYVADGNKKSDRYCFRVMSLIKQLSEGNYINPKTGAMFSPLLLEQLLSKYEKEIKMYKRHLEILNRS